MSSFYENGFVARHFVAAHAFKAEFLGFEMYAQPNAGKVQNSRNNACFNNFHIRNAYKFGHQKGCRAHYRRH